MRLDLSVKQRNVFWYTLSMYRIIFRHFPKRGKVREFIKVWQKNCEIIMKHPGALKTQLFQSNDDPQVYYAVADWRSEEDRTAAFESISQMKGGEDILRGHEQYLIDGQGEVVAHLELITEANPPEKKLS